MTPAQRRLLAEVRAADPDVLHVYDGRRERAIYALVDAGLIDCDESPSCSWDAPGCVTDYALTIREPLSDATDAQLLAECRRRGLVGGSE